LPKKDRDKPKAKQKAKAAPPVAASGSDDVAAQRRVAFLRHKLTKAMDDPLMRDQIVKAFRTMINEEK